MASDKPQNLIDYIVENTNLNQAGIAEKLEVSRAQVSKWKAGDHISYDREKQLLDLAGLFDTPCVEWAMFAKTKENAQAWYDYFLEIIEDIDLEWGQLLEESFHDSPDLYAGKVIADLCDLGANVEQQAPTMAWGDEAECEVTPLTSALYSILEAWGQLRVWLENVLDFEYMDNNLQGEFLELESALEWLSFDLALGDTETDLLTAIGIEEAKLNAKLKKSRSMINAYLHTICRIRTEHGLPIADNYFQLLYLPPVDLAELTWFRPRHRVDSIRESTIKSYLPYGQQLILSQLNENTMGIDCINEKLDQIISMLSGDGNKENGLTESE